MESKSIRYEGVHLGQATPLDENTTRLVLKKEARQFRMLRKLIDKYESLVIDIDEPHGYVAEQIIELASRPDKRYFPPVESPKSTQRLLLEGNTYPVRKALKELGMRWDPKAKVWWTYDKKTFETAKSLV